MKLVEILARELKVWPKGVLKIVQNYSHNLEGYGENCGEVNPATDCWNGRDYTGFRKESKFLASDRRTAIVTRADWEAERAKLKVGQAVDSMAEERAKLKTPKANGDGWVRHRGGKCPVDDFTLVDVKWRDGSIHEGKTATSWLWYHTKDDDDIMRYKIHKPAEQLDPAVNKHAQPAEQQSTGQDLHGMLRKMDGPDVIQWRDRIRELDTQRAEVESTYQRQISEITQERESLVQRLAGEGLALVEVVVQPVEDMSDPVNWRKGDLITFVEKVSDRCFTTGKQYIFEEMDGYGSAGVLADDEGDENGWAVEFFKWHSRPAI